MTINGREIKTVAVDFDGTLFVEKYPDIGDPIAYMIKYVKELQDQGVELVLYTAREGELLKEAIAACATYGLHFDYINESPTWRVEEYGYSRKVGADLYIDDRAVHPENLEAAVKYRIFSNEDLRKEYETNSYFRKAIGAILENNNDYLPAIYVMAQRLQAYDNIQEILRSPSASSVDS